MDNEISSEEFKKLLKKKHKYRAKTVKYNGNTYSSKKEANRAQELDLMVLSGEVKSWERQIRVPLHVNGKRIGYYIPDFLVIDKDGNEWYEDTKGYATQLFKWKLKHFRAEYPGKELRIL